MESPSLKFAVVAGGVTEEEEAYCIQKGLKYENSSGELLEVSTDVEASFSSLLSQSQQESLLLFEDQERLLVEIPDPNEILRSDALRLNKTPRVSKSSLNRSQIKHMDVIQVNEPIEFDEMDEDKENVYHDNADQYVESLSPSKLCLENQIHFELDQSKDNADLDNVADKYDAEMKPQELSQLSDNFIIPCAQYDSAHDESLNSSGYSNVDVVPATQEHNAQEKNDEISINESFEIVPCTQAYEGYDKSQDSQSQLDISSVPCSQESVGLSGSSKEDLDDTLTLMTKLLELADEQEAKEMAENDKDNKPVEQGTEEQKSDELGVGDVSNSNDAKDDIFFKTPLKHVRVQHLKNKKMCTPSPPRSHVNTLLHRGGTRKTEVVSKPALKIQTPVAAMSPKRAPLTNITPTKSKKAPTNTSTPHTFKTPVAAKVDSGLRSPPFAVGLSPVANYIYSKPAPSTFARVQGIPKMTTSKTASNSSFSHNSSVTRIPIPPSRISQAQAITKTPNSEPRHKGPLRTSTFFDTSCTPPKILSNEIVDSKKRFQPLQYTGSTKVKTINGKVNNSPGMEYVAHRHTGLRDDSGNASFVQNTLIQKRNIPQFRLATPKSYKNN